MCLEELAKKDKLWREIAFNLCRSKYEADEIVQEFYIRRIDNEEGKSRSGRRNGKVNTDKWNDYYCAMVLRSIFLNRKKVKKNEIPTDEIRAGKTDQTFEPNDYEFSILEKTKELTFNQRELLELSYDYSFRGIEERFGVSYIYAYRETKKAREILLNGDLSKYTNNRNRHRNMAKQEKAKNEQANEEKTIEYYEGLDKRSREYKTYIAGKEAGKKEGLGDKLEKAIETLLPASVVKVIKQADCGCDDRKVWVNEKGQSWKNAINSMFGFGESFKPMETNQLREYGEFVRNRNFTLTGSSTAKGRLQLDEIKYVCQIYSLVFRRTYWEPECSSCLGSVKAVIGMVYKLDTVYFNSIE